MASRQRFESIADDPATQLLPEFLKEAQAVEGQINTLQRNNEEQCDAHIKEEDLEDC